LESGAKQTGKGPRSLLASAKGPDRLIGWGLLLAAFLLMAGWLLPMMTLSRFVFLSQEVSLLQGVWELAKEGEYFLFALLAGFSILFPAVKLLLGLLLWYGAAEPSRQGSWLRWLDFIGRWSMLDVFVVALIVVAVKVSLIDDVELHGGLYAFTLAILLSMLCLRRMEVLAERVTSSA
jgi:paraquat-inducible protein A